MHIMREEGRRRLSVLPKPRLLALAVALASLAALVVLGLVAPMTLAANSNPDNHPPKAVLMKGDTAIQEGLRGSPCWSYWSKTGHHWNSYCADVGYAKKSDLYPRQAVPVPAGSTLRIRLYKPQRPDSIELVQGFKNNPRAAWGWGRPLPNSLRRVERNGKTVAWDIVFRVVRPDRHRYLGVEVLWEQVPGTHSSSGDSS